MDSIQRLIENIGEYQDLLGFLFENYKTVLLDFKNKKRSSKAGDPEEPVTVDGVTDISNSGLKNGNNRKY